MLSPIEANAWALLYVLIFFIKVFAFGWLFCSCGNGAGHSFGCGRITLPFLQHWVNFLSDGLSPLKCLAPHSSQMIFIAPQSCSLTLSSEIISLHATWWMPLGNPARFQAANVCSRNVCFSSVSRRKISDCLRAFKIAPSLFKYLVSRLPRFS